MAFRSQGIAVLLALAVAGGLYAQVSFPFSMPDGTAGVPYTLDFGEGLRDIPTSGENGVEFSFSFTIASGSLPPGLSLRPDGLFSGTPTTPGNYSFAIKFTLSISVPGVPPFAYDETLNATMRIQGGSGPQLLVEPSSLAFSFVSGASASSTQSISLGNRGSDARGFTATAITSSGGPWLSVSPASGTVSAFTQTGVSVTASPSGLAAGTYLGRIAIAFAGAASFNVNVLMVISGGQQSILLSQTGLTFRAVSGGGAPPPQSFSILNAGAGALSWTATASTLSGGASWLSITPASGRSDATSSGSVTVSVNPLGLAAGDYYGQVQIASAGVANSPQSVSVVLTVVGPDLDPGPVVQPTGLIFVGIPPQNPASQSISITNLSAKPLTFNTSTFFEQGSKWFTVQPAGGTVAPGQPASIAVQTNLTGLAPGVYRGSLTIRFVETNVTRHVEVLFIIPRTSSSALPQPTAIRPLAGTCTPAQLLPVFTLLGVSFTTTAAWPTSLELLVVDDCGQPMTSGSAVVTFSNGDPAIALTNLRDGRWSGTWQPRNITSAPVTITAKAQTTSPRLEGTASIGGGVQPNDTVPTVKSGGAVSAASYLPQVPLAPGSAIAIFGAHLAQGLSIATDLPLKTELNGTQVILAGRPLPLIFASDSQINALVPYDVPINAVQQLIVRRASAYSVPEQVPVAIAQPAIFTKDLSGKGIGIVVDVKPDGTQFVVDTTSPASAGDAIVIYCAGLGPVDPPVAAGSAAPSSPLSQTSSRVIVTIGGQTAQVLFAGLAPGFAGLYQVNAIVPGGIPAAPDVPLVLTVADQSSSPVTIALQ